MGSRGGAPSRLEGFIHRWDGLWVAGSFAVSIILGGATHGDAISTLIVRLVCVPLLVAGVARLPRNPSRQFTFAVWLLAAAFILPVLQLIPLPPAIWQALPGRQFLVTGDRLAGLHGLWRPLSLTPDATLNMLPALAVPAAFFFATASLDETGRRILSLVILLCALGAVILGGLQVLGGPESTLRFYAITNADSAVGFFANRNHQAALLVAGIPFAAYWALWLLRVRGMAMPALIAIFLGLIFVLIIGLGVTRSRAGVVLGLAAIVGSLAMMLRTRNAGGARPLLLGFIGAIVTGAVTVGLFSLSGLLDRFQSTDAMTNGRLSVYPTIAKAASSFWPAGAGFGAFVPVYQMFEPVNSVSGIFLNHAHNDYLELWLEGGLPAVLLVAAGLAWVGWTGLGVWSARSTNDRDLPRAASVIVLALLVHSMVDYPIRTAAIAAVFGVCCGMMIPSRER
jgi:O-antigen ligase